MKLTLFIFLSLMVSIATNAQTFTKNYVWFSSMYSPENLRQGWTACQITGMFNIGDNKNCELIFPTGKTINYTNIGNSPTQGTIDDSCTYTAMKYADDEGAICTIMITSCGELRIVYFDKDNPDNWYDFRYRER